MSVYIDEDGNAISRSDPDPVADYWKARATAAEAERETVPLETYQRDIGLRDEAYAALEAELAAELRTLRAKVERLTYGGIHTCSDECQRLPCVLRREIKALRAKVQELEGHREAALLEGMGIMREAALRALQTAQYDPAPYTKGKAAISNLDPAAILAQHTRAKAMDELIAGDGDLYDAPPSG